jgi:Zn-dependent peptidase ImmA (M78 family)
VPDFWPTFFHEAAHILLHGKKEIFLEHLNNSLKNYDKEQEADDLAKKYL